MIINQAIPTNVITGFLGAGKSTAIAYLLANKPKHERWAVLVNEFGDVGVDALLIGGETTLQGNVFIREVAGGCMCCAAGAPMRVVLNQLLAESRPQRLLIEPTGLGHPKEILRILQQKNYRGILELRATLTLLDARKVADPLYANNQLFLDQLSVADAIVANKADLYDQADLANLKQFLVEKNLSHLNVHAVAHGVLELGWLDQPLAAGFAVQPKLSALHTTTSVATVNEQTNLPECGYVRRDHQEQGFVSSGWLFDNRYIFAAENIKELLQNIEALRVKAVIYTDQGALAYNRSDGDLQITPTPLLSESRIELVGQTTKPWLNLTAQLLAITLR